MNECQKGKVFLEGGLASSPHLANEKTKTLADHTAYRDCPAFTQEAMWSPNFRVKGGQFYILNIEYGLKELDFTLF